MSQSRQSWMLDHAFGLINVGRWALGVLCLVLILAPSLSPAQSPSQTTTTTAPAITPPELDQSIDRVVSRPQYSWRLPRQKKAARQGEGLESEFWQTIRENLRNFFRKIQAFFERIGDWTDKKFQRKNTSGQREVDWRSVTRALLFVLLVVVSCVLAVLIYRTIRDRRRIATVRATPIPHRPDLLDENVTATDLPSEEWMAMAGELLDRGDLRLALRAMFLACLATLAHRDCLVIAAHKSNREYISEITRKSHDRPLVVDAFIGNVGIVERVWYGEHQPTDDLMTLFQSNHDSIFKEEQAS